VHGVPVFVAVDDLGVGADRGRGGLDSRAVADDGVAILGRQRHDAAAAPTDPPAGGLSGLDHEVVGTEAGDGPLVEGGDSVANLHRRDDRGDADDDTDAGQGAAHDVTAQGTQSGLERAYNYSHDISTSAGSGAG